MKFSVDTVLERVMQHPVYIPGFYIVRKHMLLSLFLLHFPYISGYKIFYDGWMIPAVPTWEELID